MHFVTFVDVGRGLAVADIATYRTVHFARHYPRQLPDPPNKLTV